jgi:hypothetical protein
MTQLAPLYDPVKLRAEILGSNLRMGKGKTEALMVLIAAAVGTPCPYCHKLISLENCSIDHMEPYGDRKVREHGTRATKESFDRIDNLQITCKKCNLEKEDFSDLQYRQLLSFMEEHPGIAPLLKKRLARSRMLWKR